MYSWLHARHIYDANARTALPGGPWEQVVHEFDFLATPWNEWFFVLAVFGLELAINLGGPDIEGYERWLRENSQISPFYLPDKPNRYPRPTSAENEGT